MCQKHAIRINVQIFRHTHQPDLAANRQATRLVRCVTASQHHADRARQASALFSVLFFFLAFDDDSPSSSLTTIHLPLRPRSQVPPRIFSPLQSCVSSSRGPATATSTFGRARSGSADLTRCGTVAFLVLSLHSVSSIPLGRR